VDDPDLALDAAWDRVLTDGFGLYHQSLSDVQFLVERLMDNLRRRAFEGGPGALARAVPDVQAALAVEREQQATQDIIDGLHVEDFNATPLYVGLRQSERGAGRFGEAMHTYLARNVQLGFRDGGPGGTVWYRRSQRGPLGGLLFGWETDQAAWRALDPESPEALRRIGQELAGPTAVAEVHLQTVQREVEEYD
jgi:hypothetical protein